MKKHKFNKFLSRGSGRAAQAMDSRQAQGAIIPADKMPKIWPGDGGLETIVPLSKLSKKIRGTLSKARTRGANLFMKVSVDTKQLQAIIDRTHVKVQAIKARERADRIRIVNGLAQDAHANAKAHGFWQGDRADAECLALMHAELSEALEALRDPLLPKHPYAYALMITRDRPPKPYGIAEELADTIIRIFDFCGARRIDIGRAVIDKMFYNQTRPYKHGKKF